MSKLFLPAGADGGPLDVTKAVRYVEGMVLGVDDFQQQHTYLAGLGQEALRLGVGPGTATGLPVTAVPVKDAGGATVRIEVRVGKGTAIDAQGRIIRVPDEQCADVAAWMATNPEAVKAKVSAPAGATKGTLTLRVTVAYSSTPTDEVPVPGEPCRSDDRLMAASRTQDDYRLDLAAVTFKDPTPQAPLEDALQQFVGWTRYAFVFGAVSASAVDDTEALLRACRTAAGTARFLPLSLEGRSAVVVPTGNLDVLQTCLDAANVLLVTELLPKWLDDAPKTAPPADVFLADVAVDVMQPAGKPWTVDLAPTAKQTASSRGRLVAQAGPSLRAGCRLS